MIAKIMYPPEVSHKIIEDFLKIIESEGKFVRVDIPGPGNPVPKIMMPTGLERDTAIILQHETLSAYWNLFTEFRSREFEQWAIQVHFEKKSKMETHAFYSYSANAAAATTMVFRNPMFIYGLSHAFTKICETYQVDIRLFWQRKEYIRTFSHDPQFEIPAPNFRECAYCGKRFVPIGRNAKTQRFCTKEEREKARYRRAYLRRKKEQGTLSESKSKELHGLECAE